MALIISGPCYFQRKDSNPQPSLAERVFAEESDWAFDKKLDNAMLRY
jgi:hypothetical protein